jgi:hypothetical protein
MTQPLAPPPSDLIGEDLLVALRDTSSPEFAWAVDHVSDYFHGSNHSGRRFERLGRTTTRTDGVVLDASDVVALSMLGMHVPGSAAIEILEHRRTEITNLLLRIPDASIHEVGWSALQPGSAADELWYLLDDIWGLGETKVSKLMARKRPGLIPIYDDRVVHRLGSPPHWWESQWTWWRDGVHVAAMRTMREHVGRIEDISLLRVFDVAVWRYDAVLRPVRRPEPGHE